MPTHIIPGLPSCQILATPLIYTWTNQGLLHTVVGTTVETQLLIGSGHFLISSTRSQFAEVQTVRGRSVKRFTLQYGKPGYAFSWSFLRWCRKLVVLPSVVYRFSLPQSLQTFFCSVSVLENPKYFHTADVLFFLGTNSSTTTGFSSPCIVVVRCCALYIVVCLLLSVSSLPKRKGVETLAACVGKTPDL